jgi:transposase
MHLKRVAIDTSKSVFTLHGVDAEERAVLRRDLRRGQMEAFFAKLPPTEVALEAAVPITGGGCYRRRATG